MDYVELGDCSSLGEGFPRRRADPVREVQPPVRHHPPLHCRTRLHLTPRRCEGTGVLIFLFVAFQFFVLAFVDFPTISQLKGN